MKKKKLLWAASGVLLTSAPLALLVSCNQKDSTEVINLDTSSKLKLVEGAKKFYDAFLSSKTLDKDLYELDINLENVSESVTLKKAEVEQVRNADQIPAITDTTNIDSFKDAAEAILGQGEIYVLKDSGGSLMHPSLKVGKQNVIDKILDKDFGGALPGDISLKDILDKDGNAITGDLSSLLGHKKTYKLVFEGSDANGAIKQIKVNATINIDHSQAAVDKHESKGGKIKHAITAVHEKIRGFTSKFKKIFSLTKDKIKDWGNIAVGLTQNVIDVIVEKAADLIPPVAIITKIPVLGGKIISFLQDHVINPIVTKVMKPIADKLNKTSS